MGPVGASDILAGHAASRPDQPALIEGDRVVTFAQLNSRANQAAAVMAGLGCGVGDRVAIMAYNSVPGFEISNGLRKSQGIVVPIGYRLRGGEVAYLLNDSGARVVCAGPEFVPVVEEARPQVKGRRAYVALGVEPPAGWVGYEELMAAAPDREPEVGSAGSLGASMIYTSGTTGQPKGAYRPQGVNLENVLQVISIFELSDRDLHLMCGPGYHSAVAFFAGLHQLLGATNVIQRKFDAEPALELIARHRVTTTFMAPTLLKRLVDLPEAVRARHDTSSLRALILGAAPCPQALKERAVAWLGEVLWEFYGATETGINTVLRPEDQLRKPGSCGTAVPGQEIRLTDEEGVEVPAGQPGEFWVRNGWLAEYYNRPDATGRSQRDGFFSVGDVAYRDGDGYYYICDRKVDMIISGGVNIYPAEVEAALYAHPAVRDAAVIGVPDDEWGESVKAVVELRPGAKVSEQELIDFCAGRLASYKKPRSVDFVPELPRDLAGKMMKRELKERYWAGAGRRV